MDGALPYYFIKGFLVGFSVAAPIGPMAIFCIRQTLAYGLLCGVAAGAGISLADGFYSWLASISSNLIQKFISDYAVWFYGLGGLILVYLGVKIFRSPIPSTKDKTQQKRSLFASFTSTLFLTFASPMTTLLFVGMFTTYGVFDTPLLNSQVVQLVLGVITGAMTWWLILTSFVHFVHTRSNMAIFKYVNRISGVGIFSFGVYVFFKLFKQGS